MNPSNRWAPIPGRLARVLSIALAWGRLVGGWPADLRSEAARWRIEHGHEKEALEWTALILRQRPGHPATYRPLADDDTRIGNLGLANEDKVAARE